TRTGGELDDAGVERREAIDRQGAAVADLPRLEVIDEAYTRSRSRYSVYLQVRTGGDRERRPTADQVADRERATAREDRAVAGDRAARDAAEAAQRSEITGAAEDNPATGCKIAAGETDLAAARRA